MTKTEAMADQFEEVKNATLSRQPQVAGADANADTFPAGDRVHAARTATLSLTATTTKSTEPQEQQHLHENLVKDSVASAKGNPMEGLTTADGSQRTALELRPKELSPLSTLTSHDGPDVHDSDISKPENHEVLPAVPQSLLESPDGPYVSTPSVDMDLVGPRAQVPY